MLFIQFLWPLLAIIEILTKDFHLFSLHDMFRLLAPCSRGGFYKNLLRRSKKSEYFRVRLTVCQTIVSFWLYIVIFSFQQTEEPFRQFAEALGALPDRARGPKHHQPCWKRLKYLTDFSILYFRMVSKLKSIDLTSDMKLLRVGVTISVFVTWAPLTEISPKKIYGR